MKKHVLLIAGGGTLGGYASMELLKRGYAVDVIALNECVSLNRNLTWIQKSVDDALLAELFKANRYDAIVDFIHYRDPEAYKPRCEMLLANTDQLVFLSSYRVYADEEHPVRETSPQLLNVVKDPYFLENEKYAVPKSHNENTLRASGKRNWTIIRPLISFSHFRLDIVTTGASELLIRSREHKPILLPEKARDLTSGVGWSGNIGKMIAALIGNEKALGEAFTLGTGEQNTWGQVADMYTDLLGAQFAWVPTEDYLQNATDNSYGQRCALLYDRLFDRRIDTSKLFATTGLSFADFTKCYDGIVNELAFLSNNPSYTTRFDNPGFRARDAKADAYLASH